MPVGEPSLSMQGSLPPPFLSLLLTLHPSLSILVLIVIFSPLPLFFGVVFFFLKQCCFFLSLRPKGKNTNNFVSGN